MPKVEIELNDDQYEKFKILESKGISPGEAIDMLFNVRDNITTQSEMMLQDKITETAQKKEELAKEMEKLDKELDFYDKLVDENMDYTTKLDIFEKEYSNIGDSYEMEVQRTKRNISWAKDFFRF